MPYSSRSGEEDRAVDQMFTRLEPDLGEAVEQTYRRRRTADVNRAVRTPYTPSSSRLPFRRSALMARRKNLFITGGVVAGLAAAAIVVPGAVSGHTAHDKASVTAHVNTGTTTVDARSFLLTAAETATHAPTASGRFWYTRTRIGQLVRYIPGEYRAKVGALIAERAAEKKAAHGDSTAIKAAERDFNAKLTQLKLHSDPPFSATAGETEEAWRARQQGGTDRTVTRPVAGYSFASPQDEAKWKAMGSPALTEPGTHTSEGGPKEVLSIGNPSLTIRSVSALPTDASALGDRLRRLYKERTDARPNETYATYLWQTGSDLLTAPITSGTRAALFRVLAGQSGIKARSGVRDALGRKGVVLTVTEPGDETTRGDVEYRMIIDPRTAELLQTEVRDQRPVALLTETYEQMGWVGRPGQRP